jgi:hypothetical protein
VLAPPVTHSDRLHVVERFSVDATASGPMLRRSYTAEDPVNFASTYRGDDMLAVADVGFAPDECSDRTFVDYSKEGRAAPAAPTPAKPWWKFWD